MKDNIKKWLQKNKVLLITFGITSVVTFLLTLFEVNLILSNLQELEHYAATGIMTDKLKSVGLLGLINLAVIGFWSLLLLIIVWKVIFPDVKSLKRTFYVNELSFLMNLPSNVTRELDRK